MSDLITELERFIGTNNYYKHSITRKVYTDGVHYLAEKAEAYWLIDLCMLNKKADGHPFVVFDIEVDFDKNEALITVTDGNKNVIDHQFIPITAFPIKSVMLWLVDNVLMLPSEY